MEKHQIKRFYFLFSTFLYSIGITKHTKTHKPSHKYYDKLAENSNIDREKDSKK